MLTAHVLIAWRPRRPGDEQPEPQAAYPYLTAARPDGGIDESTEAWQEATRHQQRLRAANTDTTFAAITVSSSVADPSGVATALVLNRARSVRRHDAVPNLTLTPATPEQTSQISALEAAEYLRTGHGLVLDDSIDGCNAVLLALARRALCGDPCAQVALAEFCTEHDALPWHQRPFDLASPARADTESRR